MHSDITRTESLRRTQPHGGRGTLRARRYGGWFVLLLGALLPGIASAALSITPITWNIIGLDSNDVTVGPNRFPGGARVCTDGTPSNGPITVTWNWTTANALINLRPGSQNPVILPAMGANTCADAYFEVEVTRSAAAYNTTRRYRIDADDADPGVTSSPVPREMYIERLISQSRNAISDIQFGTSLASLTSVAPGGSMNLVVGNTYFIRLTGGTATQGYEQLETFIGFKNTVFRILDVNSTFPADSSPTVSSPTNTLYFDACVWENDVNSPNYRACLGVGKAGGSPVQITYQVMIISGGGTTESLNSLFHDFSGSSYHYNGDYDTSVRFANILDPTTSTVSKSFTPSTIPQTGTSTLSFVVGNPNPFSVSGYSLIDNLPAGVVVSNPVTTSTSGCGTPTFAPSAGSGTVSFSNVTVGANSSCTLTVQVTSATPGTYNNLTNPLLIDGITTGKTAAATLTVTNQPAPPACTPGLELATWTMPAANGTAVPPAFTFRSSRVATALASFTPRAVTGTNSIDTTTTGSTSGANSWAGVGWNSGSGAPAFDLASYFQFQLDTSNFTGVSMSLRANPLTNWASPNNNELYFRSSTDNVTYSAATQSIIQRATWNSPAAFAAVPTGTASTFFRVYAVGVSNGTPGQTADLLLDDIVFTGCGVPALPPLAKAFNPTTIAVNGTSTLTFTLTNENNVALTGAAFTDVLPTGLQVAATPAATNTCGGTWSPTAGATTLTFSGGTIPARVGTTNGSCTLSVAIRATSAGSRTNVSGAISTTQTGTNSGPNGFGVASLTAISPPVIAKQFSPSPILAGSTSRLTFTITNPNPSNAISSVGFTDTFPLPPGAPAAMVVANPASPTNSCSPAGTWTTTVGAGAVSLTGAGVPAGSSCTVSVMVTVPTAGTYNNLSGNVSHFVNGVQINGNTASAALIAETANPGISLIKQVSTSPTGPWVSYLGVPVGTPLYYQFTIENTGDVALNMPASPGFVTDVSNPGPSLNMTPCFAQWTNPLPVAVFANDNHIDTCVIGPVNAVVGGVDNTGTASSPTGNVSDTSTASYRIIGISLDKTADRAIYGHVGEVVTYSFLVTNTGSAILSGPVVINDDKTTNETCPALSTIGDFDNFFDPGEQITCSATYTITAGDATAGSVTNIATATAGGALSNQDSVTITYAPPELNVTKTVNPDPVNIGDPATYTVTITNSGPTATQGNITIADDLPTGMTYTSSSGTNWTCDGNDPLSCTFTGTLAANGGSTQLQIVVMVGVTNLNGNNTARASGGGDPLCPPAPAVAQARCSGTVIVGTVPVILSDVSVHVEGRELVVRFSTASEDGALGFRAHAGDSVQTARRQAIGLELTPAEAGLLVPQDYEMRAPFTGQTHAWIEEVSIKGDSTFYGPFPVGTSRGGGNAVVATDWTAIHAEQQAFRISRREALTNALNGNPNAAQAELRVRQSGWISVRFEDLLAEGIDWSGVPADRIELLRGDRSIPVDVQGGAEFGPGSAIAFLGEAVRGSLYTETAVYRLRVADGEPLLGIFAGTGPMAASNAIPARFEHAPNRQYSSAAPLEDPWYARRLVRNGAPSASLDEVFELPAKSAVAGRESIEVDLWGGLDFPQAPDHSVRLRLNGTEIARLMFDGVTRQQVQANLPPGLLVSGANTLTIELIGDTGLSADVVHLEAIRVDYNRQLQAVDNRIDFAIPDDSGAPRVEGDRLFVDDFDAGGSPACAESAGCGGFRVTGFTTPDTIVVRQRGAQVDRLMATSIPVQGGGFELRFASTKQPGDRFWVAPVTGAAPAGLAQAIDVPDPLAGGAASYLMIAHPSFIDGLAPLVAARQAEGFTVRVLDVEDLYRYYNDGVVDPIAIQMAIADAYTRLGTRYVLLVGGDTLDYMNYTGANSISYVPTPYRTTSQFIRFGAADGVYSDVDGDGLSDLAIGRFPVRTAAELDAVIAKTLAYATANFGGRSVLVSDRTSGGVNYGNQLAPIGNYLGAGWTNQEVRLQNYPSGAASQARSDLVAAVDSGAALVAYLGHSAPGTWTFEGLLTSSHVYGGAFSNASKPTLVWSIGCYGTYFVDPLYNTVAHGLLLQGNGGAAAVLGASGLTEVSSDIAWINAIGNKLTVERVGDAQRLAQRILKQAGPEFRDLYLGANLLGDPALRLHP